MMGGMNPAGGGDAAAPTDSGAQGETAPSGANQAPSFNMSEVIGA